MLKNNRLHFFGVKFGENNTGSHVMFAISNVRNVSGCAMLLDWAVSHLPKKERRS